MRRVTEAVSMTNTFTPQEPWMSFPMWKCPACELTLMLVQPGSPNSAANLSIATIIREHLTGTHGYNATGVRVELDLLLKSLTL